MPSAPTIRFEVRRSPSLLVAHLLLSILAIAAVWLGMFGQASARTLLLVAIVAVWVIGVWRLWHPRLHYVHIGADGVRLQLASGETVEAQFLGGRAMGPIVMLELVWVQPKRGQTMLWLLPDNADAMTRRHLRMLLSAHDYST